jgi:hypothetical protein
MNRSGIIYRPREDATPEAERNALASVFRYVLFDLRATKGDPHDLTSHLTKECTTRPDKKGMQNADLHGD